MKGLSTQARYMLGMVVDATGSGMYLPLSLLFFHYNTGLPVTRVGAILSSAALLGLISNPISGVLVDRFGARAVVVGGYLIRAAGFAIYPFVHSTVPMFIAVAFVALGDVSFPPSIQSFVAEIVQGSARDKLIAAQRSLRNAGLGLGGLIAGAALALRSDAAYTTIIFVASGAFLAAAILVRTIAAGRRGGATVGRTKRGYRLVARNRPFLGLTLLNVPTAFGYMVLNVVLPVYAVQVLHTPSSMVGLLYAVNTVGIALLQIPVTRRLTRYRRTRMVALGAGVFGVSFLFYATLGVLSTGVVLIVGVFAATLLFTAGELLHGATATALVANAAPEETRGRHLAVYQLSWAIPTALAPAVLTALLAFSVPGMWLILAAGVTASALGVLRLERSLPEDAVRPVAATPVRPTPEPEPVEA